MRADDLEALIVRTVGRGVWFAASEVPALNTSPGSKSTLLVHARLERRPVRSDGWGRQQWEYRAPGEGGSKV